MERGGMNSRHLVFGGFLSLATSCSPQGSAHTLHAAAAEGDVSGIRAALSAGADVNALDDQGKTALLLAVGPHGSCDAVELLISKGADVNRADRWGNTPLMDAAMWVALPCVRQLLDHGAQVNAQDANGITAAMLVGNDGGNGTLSVLTLLLDRGADTQLRAKEGRSVYSSMASYGRQDLVSLLRERGVKE
jgi:ankyrin repeat protein